MQTRSLPFVFFFISLFIIGKAVGQTVDMVGPSGSGAYGTTVTVLPNGNYVVTDPYYSEGGVDSIGAVYLYNGSTNALISVLKGSSKNDWVGSKIVLLTNGNYVVSSPSWNSSGVNKVGAVTWCSGTMGIAATVSSLNSLVGNNPNDSVGLIITPLTNGNYVVGSPFWNSKIGAATWCSGLYPTTLSISSINSLVGSNIGDEIGLNVTALANGNYVVGSIYWNAKKGAATWGNGSSGPVGIITSTNSLVGSNAGDLVGSIAPLTTGNYVIYTQFWNNGRGSVTWGNGAIGIKGAINSVNSLIGINEGNIGDHIGFDVAPLKNGNYVARSINWNGNMGSATWGDGTKGISGNVTSSNSLVGSHTNDYVSSGIVAPLTNGNYVISSGAWNGGIGAATWGNGTTGVTGAVGINNSLTGSNAGDNVGIYITALTNGNYVIDNYYWNSGTGAATWGNGTTGIIGKVNASNSLVGSAVGDHAGNRFRGITALTNGNYVVACPACFGTKGSVTWANGTTGISGNITVNNSFLGSSVNDQVGSGFVSPLANGNYVIPSPTWNGNVGAATWANGKYPLVGFVTAGNSLIGALANDQIGGYSMVVALANGNYVMRDYNWNGGKGEVTWGNANGGTVGIPNSCNSVFGTASNGGLAMSYSYDTTYNYLLVTRPADNIVSHYYPILNATPSTSDINNAFVNGNSPLTFPTTTGCGQIAVLTPSGTSPVSGSVTAKTWLESPQPTYFVARHYEITPTINPSTSTGTITLYYTQGDFDGFNNQSPAPAALLPTSPNDATGKSHLLVEKQGGVSNVGTGLPGTYPGPITTINPADSNIVWNTALNRWEVMFDVTGFSGFFIKTATAAIVLPLQLLNFSGTRQGNNNLLQWTTSNEVGTKTFVVESSTNGISFAAIGNIAATGGGKYAFTDISPITNRTYYRLKMLDADGKFTYSNIIWINSIENNSISLYPNPAGQTTTLNINNNLQLIGTKAQLTDADGRLLQQINITHSQQQIDLSALPNGVYFLKLKDGAVVKLMKRQL